jgi:hypothetical protein
MNEQTLKALQKFARSSASLINQLAKESENIDLCKKAFGVLEDARDLDYALHEEKITQ